MLEDQAKAVEKEAGGRDPSIGASSGFSTTVPDIANERMTLGSELSADLMHLAGAKLHLHETQSGLGVEHSVAEMDEGPLGIRHQLGTVPAPSHDLAEGSLELACFGPKLPTHQRKIGLLDLLLPKELIEGAQPSSCLAEEQELAGLPVQPVCRPRREGVRNLTR